MSSIFILLLALPLQERVEGPKIQNGSTEDQSLEDIQKIRERIGIKLFDDPSSKREFARQLGKLNQSNDSAKRSIQDSPRPVKTRQIEPLIRGTWEKPARPPRATIQPSSALNPMIKDRLVHPATGIIGNPYSIRASSRRSATINSLIATVESLERYALELELQGEAAKSKKMRKLSRKIRKQLLELTQARDN